MLDQEAFFVFRSGQKALPACSNEGPLRFQIPPAQTFQRPSGSPALTMILVIRAALGLGNFSLLPGSSTTLGSLDFPPTQRSRPCLGGFFRLQTFSSSRVTTLARQQRPFLSPPGLPPPFTSTPNTHFFPPYFFAGPFVRLPN